MKKEIRIALVAIAGIVVLFFGMNFLKGLQLFANDNTYYISFDDISGLSPSSPIYANGFKVGTVKSISYDYNKPGDITVAVGLDKALKVPKGSHAEIVSDLLGNVQINLVLGNAVSSMLPVGGHIDGMKNEGTMGKAADMIPQVQQLLPKLDSILASLNVLFADPAIASSLHNVEHITSDLTTTTKQLNTLMAELNKNVPSLMAKANGVLENSQQLTASLASVDVERTMKKIDNTLANIEQFSNQLNDNKGSLGLLMNDRSLFDNLNATMAHADSLMLDLRAHPKRYVHFSVFGKKDK